MHVHLTTSHMVMNYYIIGTCVPMHLSLLLLLGMTVCVMHNLTAGAHAHIAMRYVSVMA